VFYLDDLSDLSDIKHHVNAKTSILGRQYTTAVTSDGTFLSFGAKNVLDMSQNGKLLILTTKINDKTV